ncbi:hypothetical protein OWV82_010467 [Melia azedarach]|uniref:Uncharacterized protein n=1 Tax=Melia azedarach TaxID=155640 RepID=A0ACC1Y724_MELAZ|nr:hypothetical protein OWV82_010467 [Melia azedarach]
MSISFPTKHHLIRFLDRKYVDSFLHKSVEQRSDQFMHLLGQTRASTELNHSLRPAHHGFVFGPYLPVYVSKSHTVGVFGTPTNRCTLVMFYRCPDSKWLPVKNSRHSRRLVEKSKLNTISHFQHNSCFTLSIWSMFGLLET